MVKDNLIYQKAFAFAVKIVNLYKSLTCDKKEFVLSKQLLKAGTSIGANVREGIEAQSRKDFISKLAIGLKEAVESEYWIDLMGETGYLDKETYNDLKQDTREIIRILNAILKTTKKSN